MIKHDDNYYFERRPLPDLGLIGNFKRFVWDREKKSLCGRNAEEWGQVGLFYLIFLSGLFSISWFQMWVTYRYVSSFDRPYFQYGKIATKRWLEPNRRSMFPMSSLNIHGPGIVVKPNLIPNSTPPLILLDESRNLSQARKHIKAINKMLLEYNADKSKFDDTCDDRNLHDERSKKSCFFDIQTLGKCSRQPYGYTHPPQPCVYIKFNKRYGWLPIVFNKDFYFPEQMPRWLQDLVRNSNHFYVWLSCEGLTDEDNKLMGEIEYIPKPGFPVQFFPFTGQSDYLSPMVALQFKNLTMNKLVNVECKTWAHNIDNENRYNLNFQIMIKDLNAEKDNLLK